MNRLHGSRGAATPLDQEKAALRAQFRAVRRALTRDNADGALGLASLGAPVLLALAGRSGVAASYNPQGAEIDPGPMSTALQAAGWRLALPRASDPDGGLEFRDASGARSPDVFGIPAPDEAAESLTPDIVLVPLLAFDRFGGRLGQGAGCYDRTLDALRAAGPVLAVGVAFAVQEVERVPVDAHDARLDLILTERGPVDVIRAQP